MSSYTKILEIKNSCRLDYFVMACSYYFDIGYSGAKEITERAIQKAEGNGLMTKECVQWIMKTAKRIAEISEGPIDLVQFCMAEDIFETQYYAGKLSRGRLEEIIQARMSQENSCITEPDGCQNLCDLYECDEGDWELLGYTLPDDEENNRAK